MKKILLLLAVAVFLTSGFLTGCGPGCPGGLGSKGECSAFSSGIVRDCTDKCAETWHSNNYATSGKEFGCICR